jgi:hypothetical protein
VLFCSQKRNSPGRHQSSITRYFNTSLGTFSDEEKGYPFPVINYLYPTYPGSGGFGHILVQENEKVGNFYGLTYEAFLKMVNGFLKIM